MKFVQDFRLPLGCGPGYHFPINKMTSQDEVLGIPGDRREFPRFFGRAVLHCRPLA